MPEEPPLVDPARMRTLRDDYGAVALQLLELYERTAAETLDELRAALAAGDAHELRRVAHRLKGSSRNVGATLMVERAAALEAGPPDPGPVLDALADALAPTVAGLRDALAD